MKNIKYYCLSLIVLASSCTLDNYSSPDSSLSGRIIDAESGELIQSDIYNGTVLNYYENEYPGLQSGVIKCDGTYKMGKLFSGDYKIIPTHTNFEPIDTVYVNVKGDTVYDFEVKPYIRISNVSIIKSGKSKVTATFTVTPTSKWNTVAKIGLFIHPQPVVGAYMNIDSRELAVSESSFSSKTFTIIYDYSDSKTITSGSEMYFRVGALCTEPDSRYNYAPAEKVLL